MSDIPGIDQGALDAARTEPADETSSPPEVESAGTSEPTGELSLEKTTVAPVDYSGWLKADLIAAAEERGLDSSGTKDDLIARLNS